MSGEWLLARPGPEVFAAARDTLRAHGFRFERDDAAAGLLVTRRVAYDARWPDAASLGLRVIHTPAAITLYVHVAPGFEPARLAVGAVLETTTAFVPLSARKVLGTSTMFGYVPMATFFAAGIADRLGVALEPIPADAAERAALSVRWRAAAPPGVVRHGTLTGLSWAGGVADANLVAAALGAAGLWRFSAPVVDGCAVRRTIMIEMSFTMGR